MRLSLGLFALCSLSAALAACNSRPGAADRPPVDGGGSHDGGTADGPTTDGSATDAGHLPDGAPLDGGATDGGPIGDGGGMDAAVSCSAPLTPLPAAAVPRCSAATHACIDGCIADAGTGSPVTCVVACEHADTTPAYTGDGLHLDCGGCLNYEQRHCIDMMGCHDAVAALDCCVAAHCPDGSCATTTCMTQYDAFSTCAMSIAGPCLMSPTAFGVARCFADVDGGP